MYSDLELNLIYSLKSEDQMKKFRELIKYHQHIITVVHYLPTPTPILITSPFLIHTLIRYHPIISIPIQIMLPQTQY